MIFYISYAAGEFGDFPQIPVTLGIMLLFGIMVLFGVKVRHAHTCMHTHAFTPAHLHTCTHTHTHTHTHSSMQLYTHAISFTFLVFRYPSSFLSSFRFFLKLSIFPFLFDFSTFSFFLLYYFTVLGLRECGLRYIFNPRNDTVHPYRYVTGIYLS